MRKRKTTAAFSLSLVALFLATLVIQPSSWAQQAQQKIPVDETAAPAPIEGQGFTTDANRINATEFSDFPLDESFDKADFETGKVPIDPDDQVAPQAIQPVPILPGGVDHAAAGTGTRNAGFGTIRLRGVPAGAQILRAWLYWGTVYAQPVPNSATAVFNGTTVTGQRINNPTAEPCWLFNNAKFVAFRANVKPLIVAGANSDYKVTRLASAITNGTDPFVCAPPFPTPPTPASEGATLLLVYAHGGVPNSSRTYIHNGPTLVTGNMTITNNLNPVLPNHSVLKQTRFGADGQVGCSLFSAGFLNGEMTLVGPTAGSLFQIKGPGSTINTNSDWNGGDGLPLNQLWDTQTDAFGAINGVTNLIPTGSAVYLVRYTGVGDCFVTVAHVLTAK